MNTHQNTIDIGEQLDSGEWNNYRKWALFIIAFTIIFDGFDIQVMGLVVPALMNEWGLPRKEFANVLAMGLIGMTIGTVIGGWVGDKFGRRAGLIGSVFVFGSLTAATALANDMTTLIVLRLLAGIGLGGALPNSTALASEVTPSRFRSQSVMLTILCVPIGSTLGGLLAKFVLPTMGWKALFVIGGLLPIAAAVMLIFVLPESPRYLVRFKQRHADLVKLMRRFGRPVPDDAVLVNLTEKPTKRTSLLALFSAEYWRDTVALWAASFFCLLGTYSVMNWLPGILASFHLNEATTSTSIAYYSFGGIIGILAATLVVGRIGSKKLMLALCSGVILSALYLRSMAITPENSNSVLQVIGIMGFFLNATQTSMFALAAHVYVSQIRGTGVGGALGVGRIGGVLSSYLVPFAMQWDSSAGYFALIAFSLLISFIALTLITRHVPPHSRAAGLSSH